MEDKKVTVHELKERMALFVSEREWNKFHSPKNLSMALSAEAAELLEKFLWIEAGDSYAEVDRNREQIEDELADVLAYILSFANAAKIDISAAFDRKLVKNAQKYPIEKARGRHTKYTDY